MLKDVNKDNEFNEKIIAVIQKDVNLIKDCSEKSIVDFYIETCIDFIDNDEQINEDFYEKLKAATRTKLANKYTAHKQFDNNIDIYFNDVKREYILHPQGESEELDFIPENRDAFIKNNLKLVVNCAKRYRNLGLPFEDLIQIGNYGLLTAWEKFDTTRANLRNEILNDINTNELDTFTHEDAENVVKRNFKYSKTLDATLKRIPETGFNSKQEFCEWAEKYIKKASFSSIGFAWIRAMILLELNNVSKIIRVPKSVQQNDETSVNIIRLDSINPYTEDNYADGITAEITNDEFAIEDETIENMEKQNLFKDLIDKLLLNLSAIDRRIIKKRFGIGVPYQLSVNEIAENEGITANKVKYIITNALKVIADKIPENDRETIIEMLR